MTATQLHAIEEHGKQLLAIFPQATDRDPVSLCKRLRRFESQAHAIALRLCNGPEYPSEDAADQECERVLEKVDKLLKYTEPGRPNVFINRDPRGYALKISGEYLKAFNLPLHRDWGGYGIIAPEID